MNIIIPMAGRGTRLRPHTLSTPKPLLAINGKTIVERLIDGLIKSFNMPIEKIAFIIGDFGKETEDKLKSIAKSKGAEGLIFYQKQALGTAHAVYCAEAALTNSVVVAFADTLFYSDFKISEQSESVIWTQKVENPEQFGVVITDSNNIVTDFVEKPKTPVSNQAIIGIYYFKNGENLKNALKKLIEDGKTVSGEYQLTDALQDMKNAEIPFLTENINQWLDCGNSQAVIDTSRAILEHEGHWVSAETEIINSCIIEPCYIADGVKITNSVIGPYVAIAENSTIRSSVISNSMLGKHNDLQHINTQNTITGDYVKFIKNTKQYDIGAYSKVIG